MSKRSERKSVPVEIVFTIEQKKQMDKIAKRDSTSRSAVVRQAWELFVDWDTNTVTE